MIPASVTIQCPKRGLGWSSIGQEMVTLAGTRLSMCTKPQQTAEMNTSYQLALFKCYFVVVGFIMLWKNRHARFVPADFVVESVAVDADRAAVPHDDDGDDGHQNQHDHHQRQDT